MKDNIISKDGITTNRLLSRGDGLYAIHSTFDDQKSLDQNERIRASKFLDQAKLDLHENEDIRFVISCPSYEQWALFKKQDPETYDLLTTRGQTLSDESMRHKGMMRLQLQHPEWVLMERL